MTSRSPILRFCISAILIAVSLSEVIGQVSISAFPQDKQLYPRALGASSAPCKIEGSVGAGQGSVSLSAKLYAGTQLIEQKDITLQTNTSSADFSITLNIPVTRQNHRVTLQRIGVNTPLAQAIEVVAGDVYIVNGQSNAVAGFSIAAVDRDSFLRGVLVNGEWTLMQFTGAGEWMGHAAKVLSNQHDVPIAAFNFAVGAQRLDFFLPQASGQGNFAEVKRALTAAGVSGKVRGLCWFQGEADGWEASIKSYREGLTSLFEIYDEEFTIDRFYAFQTRTFSCGHLEPYVMEAQRRLDRELNYLDVIASTNAVHDSCHFPYSQGYETLGRRLAEVISYREYNEGSARVLSPNIDSARITQDKEITLYFNTHGGQMAYTGNPWSEFRAEGPELRASSGTVIGNTIRLAFPSSVAQASGITYLSHSGPAPDFIHASTGEGAFTFYNIPLKPGDGEPGNYADAELVLRSSATSLVEATIFSVDVILKNTGPTTLEDVVVSIPLLRPQLIYEGGNEASTSVGEFDIFTDQWSVPSVGPRDSAVLTLSYFTARADAAARMWAQVLQADNLIDEDSSPGNGIPGEVYEDDEARIVIGDRSADCIFSVEATQSACNISGTDSTWNITLSAFDANPSSRIVRGIPGGNLTWNPNTNLALQLNVAVLRANNQLPLELNIIHTNDPTCASILEIVPPVACGGISDLSDDEAIESLKLWPNPIYKGQVLFVELSKSSTQADLPIQLFTMSGQVQPILNFFWLDSSTLGLNLDVSAGVYVVRIGNQTRQVLVLD